MRILLAVAAAALLSACAATPPPPETVYKERIIATRLPASYYVIDPIPVPPTKEEYMALPSKMREVRMGSYASSLIQHIHVLELRIKSIQKAEDDAYKRVQEKQQ